MSAGPSEPQHYQPARRRAQAAEALAAQRDLLRRNAASSSFVTLVDRQQSAACRDCPAPDPCPICPKGQVCQQVFRDRTDCNTCPTNKCLADPDYTGSSGSSSKTGPISGAISGVLGVALISVCLFFWYRTRRRRAKERAAKMRHEAKMRAAQGEVFRPGDNRSASGNSAQNSLRSPGPGQERFLIDESGGSVTPGSMGVATSDGSAITDLKGDDDEDTEWTEMRADGLTAFRRMPGEEDDLMTDPIDFSSRRRSTGAATHLSRITEGAEEEEEEWEARDRVRSLHAQGRLSIKSSATSINLDPSSAAKLGRQNSGRNPFHDAASIHSVASQSSVATRIIPITYSGPVSMGGPATFGQLPTRSLLAEPEPVHRATGAPLVKLNGGKMPQRGIPASKRPSTGSSTDSAGSRGSSNGTVNSSGAVIARPGNTMPRSPLRPSRDPTLNLRLADGSEPGKRSAKESEAVRKSAGGSSMAESEYETMRDPYSPAAPSTSQSQAFDFRNMDPQDLPNFPAELQRSAVYARTKQQDRRDSVMTTDTGFTASSGGTAALDYVMSLPQIMTPTTPGGAQRVQVTQAKASVVRSLSELRSHRSSSDGAGPSSGPPSSDPTRSFGGRTASTRSASDPHFSPHGYEPHSSDQSTLREGVAGKQRQYGSTGTMVGSSSSGSVSTSDQSPFNDAASIGVPQARPDSSQSIPFMHPFEGKAMMEPRRTSPSGVDARSSYWTNGGDDREDFRPHSRNSRKSTAGSLVQSPSLPQGVSAMAGQRRPSGPTMLGGQAANPGRQSSASIGGLSVLDGIPIQFGRMSSSPYSYDSEDPEGVARAGLPALPENAVETVERARSQHLSGLHMQSVPEDADVPLPPRQRVGSVPTSLLDVTQAPAMERRSSSAAGGGAFDDAEDDDDDALAAAFTSVLSDRSSVATSSSPTVRSAPHSFVGPAAREGMRNSGSSGNSSHPGTFGLNSPGLYAQAGSTISSPRPSSQAPLRPAGQGSLGNLAFNASSASVNSFRSAQSASSAVPSNASGGATRRK